MFKASDKHIIPRMNRADRKTDSVYVCLADNRHTDHVVDGVRKISTDIREGRLFAQLNGLSSKFC